MITPTVVDLVRSRCLLLDFDGPICSVYAGLSDHVVAQRLRDLLATNGVPIDDDTERTSDPIAVLRYTAAKRRDLVPLIDYALAQAEVEAMESATITPHLRDVLRFAVRQHTGIVSNNSTSAIDRFFDLNALTWPAFAIGRDSGDPDLMQPNPYSIIEAAKLFDQSAARCVLIGGAVSDVEAARAAGARSIGYAHQPGRADLLIAAGADAVITDMAELASALREAGTGP